MFILFFIYSCYYYRNQILVVCWGQVFRLSEGILSLVVYQGSSIHTLWLIPSVSVMKRILSGKKRGWGKEGMERKESAAKLLVHVLSLLSSFPPLSQ